MSRLLVCLLVLVLLSPTTGLGDEISLPFERVTVSVSMDMGGWKLAHEKLLTRLTLIEWVPERETIEHWSSQFRVIRYNNDLLPKSDAQSMASKFVEGLSHRCKNPDAIQHEILEADSASVLISWQASGCKSDNPYSFDQKELTRFIVGKEFTFNLAFTQKLGKKWEEKSTPALLTEQDQLGVLRSASIHESEATLLAHETDQELMNIPTYRAYALFDDPGANFGRIWFEEVGRKGTGRGTEVKYRMKTEALPLDHWYAVYMIKLPEGITIPIKYGLKPGENDELVCPPEMEGMPDIDSVTGVDFMNTGFSTVFPCAQNPNRSYSEIHPISVSDFQAGLAVALGVQTHDASHTYLTMAIPRPVQGQDQACRIELELASPDGRTYLLRGSGFVPGETLEGAWQYAKNSIDISIPVLSDGSFTYPLFHTGKAKGSRKWRGVVQVNGAKCAPSVEYLWGKQGMSK